MKFLTSTMYSLVIPAHNGSKNLAKLLKKANLVLRKTKKKFEIIIVNDNSMDNSREILENLKKEIKELIVINRTTNPGAGYAMRKGFSNVKGNIIITMDADLSNDPKEIPNFLKHLNNYDMICGSRYIKGGKPTRIYSRLIISRLFNLICMNLIGMPIRDITLGFRVFKTKTIKKIKLKSKKFGIFIEIPIKAYFADFKLKEIPIIYHKRGFGKTNLNYLEQGPEYIRFIFSALKYKLLKKLKFN